jgi:hypothetical protein
VRDDGGGLARDLAGGFGHLSPVTVIGGFSSVIRTIQRGPLWIASLRSQ